MKSIIPIFIETPENRLVGYNLGRLIFDEQIRTRFSPGNFILIVFPPNVENVSISFIQGLVDEILKKSSAKNFCDYVVLSGSDELTDRMKRILKVLRL